MPTLGTEGNWPREGIVELPSADHGRMNVFVKAGAGDLPSLRMVAAITPTATSAAKSGGNTGAGTLGSLTCAANTPAGVYTVRVTAEASGAGDFEVRDPQGRVIGTGTVAVACLAGGLGFTIADGNPDFVVGDGFDITVPETLWDNYDNGASNGTQSAQGLLLDGCDATGADDVLTCVITRGGTYRTSKVTAEDVADKAAGITDLVAKDFVFQAD